MEYTKEQFERSIAKLNREIEEAEDYQVFQLIDNRLQHPTGGLYVTPMSKVVAEPVRWLWQDRIPLGKVTILDGDPGTGKSSFSLDLAARVTTGAEMPDGTPGQYGQVILIGGEDSLADTVLPRLNAAGANLTKVKSVAANADAETIRFPDDTDALRDLIEAMTAVLVVIDPFLAFVGEEVNTYVDRDVREVLLGLGRIAEETGAAILLIRHRRKSLTGNPVHDGLGSIGIIGACRSGLLLAADPGSSTRRVLAVTKSNVGKIPNSLAFHFAETAAGAAKLLWDGPSTYTADDLSNPYPPQGKGESALQEAVEFLEEILANGALPMTVVFEQALALGIHEITLRRAKKLVVDSKKSGTSGPWYWQLKDIAS